MNTLFIISVGWTSLVTFAFEFLRVRPKKDFTSVYGFKHILLTPVELSHKPIRVVLYGNIN